LLRTTDDLLTAAAAAGGAAGGPSKRSLSAEASRSMVPVTCRCARSVFARKFTRILKIFENSVGTRCVERGRPVPRVRPRLVGFRGWRGCHQGCVRDWCGCRRGWRGCHQGCRAEAGPAATKGAAPRLARLPPRVPRRGWPVCHQGCVRDWWGCRRAWSGCHPWSLASVNRAIAASCSTLQALEAATASRTASPTLCFWVCKRSSSDPKVRYLAVPLPNFEDFRYTRSNRRMCGCPGPSCGWGGWSSRTAHIPPHGEPVAQLHPLVHSPSATSTSTTLGHEHTPLRPLAPTGSWTRFHAFPPGARSPGSPPLSAQPHPSRRVPHSALRRQR